MARLDDPATWPHGRLLPVVKPAGGLFPALGLLVAGEGPVVHACGLHEATSAALQYGPRLTYPDFTALAADGWRID